MTDDSRLAGIIHQTAREAADDLYFPTPMPRARSERQGEAPQSNIVVTIQVVGTSKENTS